MMNFQPINSPKKTIPKIASERLLVKGGKVVNHDLIFRADVFIENGIIRQLGTNLTIPGGVTTIDAKGALVLPGGIDLWTNFEASPWFDDDVTTTTNVKSAENFYNGTRAALIGGTTTVVDFVTGDKGRLMAAYTERVEESSTSCCDVSLHVDVTSWNDDVKQSMATLATEHGINSFRIHTCGRWQLNDEELFEVFTHVKSLQCVALVHAENGSLIKKKTQILKEKGLSSHPDAILSARDEDMEFEAVNRVLIINKIVQCPLFFLHVTGQKAMDSIAQYRASGLPVYLQSLAVALHRDGSSYHDPSWNQAVACVTWPPLRDDKLAQQRQLEALSNESIQCVSSGHCVYTNANKAHLGKSDFSKIPPGTNGVFERMMALWSTAVTNGYIDVNQFVSLTSTNAARIFNLYPRKGRVAVGSDADLVIWREHDPHSLADMAATLNVTKPDCTNAFEGIECESGPSVVICHGRVVVNDNQISVVQSLGKLLERPPAPPFIYNRLKARGHSGHVIGSKESGMDTPISETTLNGQSSHDASSTSSEKPERYTRSSGIRPMHQSGWSFSASSERDANVLGEQVGDGDYKKHPRFTTPPGGISHLSLN